MGKQRVIASIEARMGSSRLPGKSMMDIGGVTALTRVVNRLRLCKTIDQVILATTASQRDDVLEEWAKREGVELYRGSEDDVLHRVVQAQKKLDSEIVVEVTGDCPLLDPSVIDLGVDTFFANDCDVVTNARVPSYPQGADVQVYRLSDLELIESKVSDPAVREHVSLYFYEHPEQYRIIHLIAPRDLQVPSRRLQLDYKEDLHFIREIYKHLEPKYGDNFGIREIDELIRANRYLVEINSNCIEKPVRVE